MKNRNLLLFASVLLLIPLVLATGCSKKKSTSTTAQPTQTSVSGGAAGQPTTRPAATTAPSSGGSSGASELTALISNFAKVKSFKATLTLEATGQAKQEGTFEYVAPNKYHFVLGGLGEFISIGTDTYLKIGPTWTKSPGGGIGNLFTADQLNSDLAAFGNDSKVQKGGTETVNGTRCQLYTITDSSGTTEICVANGLPIRVVVKDAGSTTTLIFSDFDKVGDIKPPI